MVRINIEIPDELHQRLKLDSVLRDMSLKENIIRILSQRFTRHANASFIDKINRKNG
ncbi:MAG: hypothetical protein V1743_01330 [Nanoarchaeota archaeon]